MQNNMQIIEYYKSENKEYWLSQIAKSDWPAAHFLHDLLKKNELFSLVGEKTRVLMLIENDQLLSFCTLAEKDDIQPTTLTPWIGWVYTFPSHRGKRLSGMLISFAEKLAKADGASHTHISTNHIGLYEKYGYEFLTVAKDVSGDDSRVYRKSL